MEDFVCYTAPGKVFSSRADLVEHYKTDWHKYNLKRKIAKLPPVTYETFQKIEAKARERFDAIHTKSKSVQHIKRGKREELLSDKRKDAPIKAEGRNKRLDEEYTVDLEEARKPVNVCQSIFDLPKVRSSSTVEGNLEYMQKRFGFFIPDFEYLVDLEGLIKYCSQKIRAGKLCLFCDRAFDSGESAVKHMIDKSHCKIRWENEEDLLEFEDFYDFSSSSQGQESEAGEKEDIEKGTMEYLESGQLLLSDPDGTKRKIGTRAFRRYYKQKLKPDDERAAIFANLENTSQRLIQFYRNAGIKTRTGLVENVKYGQLATKAKLHAIQKQMEYKQRSKMSLKDGLQINKQIRNRVAKKNTGEGLGVHG